MILFLIIIAAFLVLIYSFMRQPRFGSKPSGARLERIHSSPSFKDGSFQNQSPTPALSEDASYYGVMKEFFFGSKTRVKPATALPAVKADLHALDPGTNAFVWFGHSSYFLQTDGKKILVDPVLSGAASPIAFTTRAFKGADVYSVADIPDIDFLFISHDHWDHMDYQTLVQLRPRIGKVITGLGTAAHLERWGFDPAKIIEKDWNEEASLGDGFTVYTTPARHFSGRGLRRNGALWTSFVLRTPTQQLFLGGDSGYDTHFAAIGKQFGSFDLAILENGQYNKSWKYIHMMPEETLQAAKDLHAKRLIPVHSAKFALSTHAWDEPLKTITKLNETAGLRLITPLIGEPVDWTDDSRIYEKWWKDVD